MKTLLQALRRLQQSDVCTIVQKKISEFKRVDTNSSDDLFNELTFCILTANFSAQRALQIHARLNTCFSTDTAERVAQKLRRCGYRFPATRATYIISAAAQKEKICRAINTLQGDERREWLVSTIDGLGYKEASHFLRNIGYDDYAIVDSHILDLLTRYHLLRRPTTLTKKRYLEAETILRTIATQAHLTVAELDLYLWYMETGTILK